MYDMRDIGNACKRYRQYLGKTQLDVAGDLGYTSKAISGFECGRSYNALILLWYVDHGIDLFGILKGGANSGTNALYHGAKYKRFN